MKCAKCGDTRHTVGEVRRCPGCQDGTASQVPDAVADGTPIGEVVGEHNGLGNRFLQGGDSAPIAAEPEQASEVAAEKASEVAAVDKPKKKGWFKRK